MEFTPKEIRFMAHAIKGYMEMKKQLIAAGQVEERFAEDFFSDEPLYEYLIGRLEEEEKSALGKIKKA